MLFIDIEAGGRLVRIGTRLVRADFYLAWILDRVDFYFSCKGGKFSMGSEQFEDEVLIIIDFFFTNIIDSLLFDLWLNPLKLSFYDSIIISV